MADIFTKEQRSEVMRQVKASRNKSTELKLIAYFKAKRIIGWRRNYKLFGKPDFTFPQRRVTVFLDGCFWHEKRARNINRDKEVTQTLQSKGWTVIRFWECELKNEQLLNERLRSLKPIE